MIEAAMFGALSRDAEAKTSKAGKSYLRLSVRVGDGDAAQWINATVFDADAIQIADKMVKGARVYIEGTIKLDEWTAQDGSKRHGLSLMSWHCRLSQIGRNKPKRETPKPNQNFPRDMHAPLATGAADMNDDTPFAPEFR